VTRSRVIEPFDAERHDRTRFTSGIAQVDNFFHRTANKLSKADNLRIFVMTEPDGAPIGFYALNAHSVDYADLPERFARTRPGHGSIPAAFIAMIAVHRDHQKQGYGGDLLVDALRRIAGAADQIGIAVVLLDVLDCGQPERVALRHRIYESFGFAPLPSQPHRLFLSVATVRALEAGTPRP
jgi:GNAT superfamily N-acetyltransferase